MRAGCAGAVALLALLAGCAPQAPEVARDDGRQPAGFPEAYYRQAVALDQRVFEIDPTSSLVVIEVRRDGALANLGHDHVVASHDVHGYIAPDAGRADLYVRLDRLTVDEPKLRTEAQFDTQPSDEAIAGTRGNMLAKLGAGMHPYAVIALRDAGGTVVGAQLDASITIKGATRGVRMAPQVDIAADAMEVAGQIALLQTDFGIVPYSILAGALKVQDRVAIRFRIRARRMAL